MGLTLLLKLLDQLERQRPASALVPVDSGGHENLIRAQQSFDVRQGNGSSLIDHKQIRLSKIMSRSKVETCPRNWASVGRMYCTTCL